MNDYEQPKQLKQFNYYELQKLARIILLQDKRKLLKAKTKIDNYFKLSVKHCNDVTPLLEEEKLLFENFKYIRYQSNHFENQVLILNSSKRGKTNRAKKRISSIIDYGEAFFLTLTFTDSVMANTSVETRHAYVKRFLGEYCDNYIANIDYGDKTGREHYHAVCNSVHDLTFYWTYGHIKMQKIGKKDSDVTKLSRYVSKLSMHAVKESTTSGLKQPRLIYSRNTNIE